MGNYKWSEPKIKTEQLQELMLNYPGKMGWFISKGYLPHYYQALFHADGGTDGRLTRFRHLVAGRR